MNRLIIVGNGFDIHNGLETSYAHFIDWYLKMAVEKAIMNKYEDKNLNIPSLRYTDALNTTGLRFEQTDKIISLLKEMKTIGGEPHTSEKIEITGSILLQTTKDIQNFGWADIEQIYYQRLTTISSNHNLINDRTRLITELNESFEEIRKHLIAYLKGLKIEPKIFFKETLKQPFDYDDFRIKYHDLIKKVGLVNIARHPENTMFVNFNYTNYWVNDVKTRRYLETRTEVINIHGDIEYTGSNSPFFGYGDETGPKYKNLESITNTDEWSKYFKTIYYLNTDNYKKILDFLDEDYFQVLIVGHSCGLSDKTLLNTIFDHQKCVNIKPFYFVDTKTEKDNWHSLMTNISRIFSNKEKMRELVVSRDSSPNRQRNLFFSNL
ncbi:MAG: bacteriophage abortive infection AbiH family protein [Salinivirgaceae bacterium]|nr:bacteriophage abortive infection AbiH family protein [Salinivirgaceae bacterium]